MNASALTAADLALYLRQSSPNPTPSQVAALIDETGAECTVHDVMQSMPPGVEELKARRLIVRERLTHRGIYKEERRDIVAELERLDAEIARASVGRRGAQ